MKQPIRVATSPLTNTIYAGRVRGNLWQSDKHDVTIDALAAVAEHAIAFGKPIVITKSGVPEFEITVKRLNNNGI